MARILLVESSSGQAALELCPEPQIPPERCFVDDDGRNCGVMVIFDGDLMVIFDGNFLVT